MCPLSTRGGGGAHRARPRSQRSSRAPPPPPPPPPRALAAFRRAAARATRSAASSYSPIVLPAAPTLRSVTCPISTEGWTRRVHFVREGEGGGGAPRRPSDRAPARLQRFRGLRGARRHETVLTVLVDPDGGCCGVRDAACPLSTKGGTRLVRLVRGRVGPEHHVPSIRRRRGAALLPTPRGARRAARADRERE